MISLFGTTIAAASSWLLLGIPCAIGFLVYIFRVRGTTNQAIVSSLLFLKDLPRRPVGRKTFVPPLQFWLELAILTLLILAVAGIYLSRPGKHVAIVVDSSLSMGALYGAGGTRLDQAKRIATLDIERAPASTTYTIFAASKELLPLSKPNESTKRFKGLLKPTVLTRCSSTSHHSSVILTMMRCGYIRIEILRTTNHHSTSSSISSHSIRRRQRTHGYREFK